MKVTGLWLQPVNRGEAAVFYRKMPQIQSSPWQKENRHAHVHIPTHTRTHTHLTPHTESSQACTHPFPQLGSGSLPPEIWCLPHPVGGGLGVLPEGLLVRVKAPRGCRNHCRQTDSGSRGPRDCTCSGLLNELPLKDAQTGLVSGKEARVPEPLHLPSEAATEGRCTGREGHSVTVAREVPAGKLRKYGT